MTRVRVDVQTATLEIGARKYPVINGYADVATAQDAYLCKVSNVGVPQRHAFESADRGKVCRGCGFHAWRWTTVCPHCHGEAFA